MKAEELRLGNYAQDGERVGFIKSIQPKTIVLKLPVSTIRMSVDDLEPIPLTEEWLLKFGFNEFNILSYGYNIFEFEKDNGVLYANSIGTPVKHVHQLQNLYFALTGKELTVKQ